MAYLDINTADWPFDAQDDQDAYPGTWYLYGSIDAQHSFDKRTLQPPFDIFQSAYNEGWNHGMYNKQFLTNFNSRYTPAPVITTVYPATDLYPDTTLYPEA